MDELGARPIPRITQNAAQPRVRLNRSKHGCLVCRQKRIKCSETKPICLQCASGSRACMWPNGARVEKVRNLQPRSGSERPIAIQPAFDSEGTPKAGNANNDPGTTAYNETEKGKASTKSAALKKSAKTAMLNGQIFSSVSRRDHPASSRHGGSTSTTASMDPAHSLAPIQAGEPNATHNQVLPQLASASSDHHTSRTTTPERKNLGFQPTISTHTSHDYFPKFSKTFTNHNPDTIIPVPPLVILRQYCSDSASTISSPLHFVRNTYLSKFQSGAFGITQLNFASSVAPILDELDPNSSLVLRDPMRLQNALSNCRFQEAYVFSLRGTFGSPIHLVRTWISSLFLLAMSLELGLMSLSLNHMAEAIACFKQADIRLVLRTAAPNDPHRYLLIFLLESTYRLSSMFATLLGESFSIGLDELPDLGQTQLLAQITRSTVFLRTRALETIHAFASATDVLARASTSRSLESINNELLHIQDALTRLSRESLTRTTHTTPFDLISHSDLDIAHITMSVVVIRLLLHTTSPNSGKQPLLNQYFGILSDLLLRQATTTIDLANLLICASLLDLQSEREWLITTLRNGTSRGHDLLLPMTLIEEILRHVWYTKSSDGMRDLSSLRELQIFMRRTTRG